MSYRPLLLTTAFVIPASLSLPLSKSFAADATWTNPGTGFFEEAANWDPAAVPSALDNAIISNGGTAQVLANEVVSVNTLRVQNGALDATGATLVTCFTSSGWQTTGDLQVGGPSGIGTLTSAGNTEILTGRVRIGGYNTAGDGDSANAIGTLDMSGTSKLETAAGGGYDFWVGNGAGSSGTLNMSEASELTVKSSMTSGRAGGSATLNLSGTSKLIVDTFANIGEGGTADWTASDGATIQIGGNLRLGGSTSTLTVEDTATVTIGGEFQIGNGNVDGTPNVGTVVISGGSITASSWMSIGREGGTGSVTMSGNAILTKNGGGNLIVGDGTTGTLTVSGNASVVSNSDIWVGLNGGGNGTLTISGGSSQTTGVVIVGHENGSQGRLNLSGGTLTASAIQKGAGTGTMHFDGGTLRAGAESVNFISNFDAAGVVIDAGGARIDTNGFAVEIVLDLVGDGGLIKAGLGTLTLHGSNTYLGDTAIEAGVLSITTGFLNDSANVHIADGSVFNLNFVGTDTVNGLVINGVGMETGTWGSLDSTADHKSASLTGTGLLEVTAVVPEPSTIALVIAGLGAVGWGMRRRR